jgi:hypothetical protein|tara:strand:- start:34 stop:645 length:612 start_codon:yes stop_codon:yes gene_type:complete
MTLKTTPIPTRNWKITKDPVSERDLKRKESKQRVDRRIYYLWFHFLKLCLELESIGHIFEKRVGGGKVILGEGKLVKVNRDEYVGWDLDNLMSMKFNEWFYGNNKCDLFNEDGFKYSGRPQYHSLVKKFNVFIRYFNGKTGDYDKDMNLSERIIRVYEKERFEQVKRNDSRSQGKSPFNKLIDKDVKDCERIILSVCEGRFPK